MKDVNFPRVFCVKFKKIRFKFVGNFNIKQFNTVFVEKNCICLFATYDLILLWGIQVRA